jgi:hypothetical protein
LPALLDIAKHPINKVSHPRINANPPIGVIAPIHLKPGITAPLIYIRQYKEPLNKIIPVIKSMPAHLINGLGNSLYKMPATSKANT